MSEKHITTVHFKTDLTNANAAREEITRLNHVMRTAFKGNKIGTDDKYLTLIIIRSPISAKSKLLTCAISIYTSTGPLDGNSWKTDKELRFHTYGPGKTDSVQGTVPTLFGAFGYAPVDDIIQVVRDHYNKHKK